MSLFRPARSAEGEPAGVMAEAIERRLAAAFAQAEPDPLFRRRLRGHLLNRLVAERQQENGGSVARREMGRLGRAVLYASVALALGGTSVAVAAQDALPGEALYPFKRQIEDLRVRVLPPDLHDDLAVYSLGQRIEEMARLAEQGRWRVAATTAAEVRAQYADLRQGEYGPVATQRIAALNAMLELLPDSTRTAFAGVLGGVPGIGQRPSPATWGQRVEPPPAADGAHAPPESGAGAPSVGRPAMPDSPEQGRRPAAGPAVAVPEATSAPAPAEPTEAPEDVEADASATEEPTASPTASPKPGRGPQASDDD